MLTSEPFTRVYLWDPLWVDGVPGHSGALLLAVVGQRGEDAVLPRLDGQLQVGVGVEEHSFLQTNGLQIWKKEQRRSVGMISSRHGYSPPAEVTGRSPGSGTLQ